VQLRTRTVEIADNRRHTGLVAHGSREVDGLLGVILGEAGNCSQLAVALFDGCDGGDDYLFTLPRWRAARFRGKNARDP
jgi:hypothetical protein